MTRRTVLYVCHNHPTVRAGGAEQYALELHEAMRASDRFRPVFLSRYSNTPAGAATTVTPVENTDDQFFLNVDASSFNDFLGTYPDKDTALKQFRAVLEHFRPEVVHFQHTLFLGYDFVRQVRNTLPNAAIVYTLQEFLPICHRQGQMVRTTDNRPCTHDSPRRCNECFPDISPAQFFLRKQLIASHLDLVDVFLAPSHFLRQQYVRWGIPEDKIRFEEYGRSTAEPDDDLTVLWTQPRARLGFFGQVTAFKGIQILLEAMQIVNASAVTARLTIHGTPTHQIAEPFRSELTRVFGQTQGYVKHQGPYEPRELPALMAQVDWVVVPSIWWENSPLVIQEAFHYGKPVICSDIGGMAEKVMDGVNGLNFRVGDAQALADVIRRATTTQGLWEKLHGGIVPIHAMADHVATMEKLYDELIERRTGESVPAETETNVGVLS